MTKEITTIEPKEIASIESFINKAIEAKLPIETMERFFALRKEVRAEEAKEAFTQSMSLFQAECPIIEKKKGVNDKNGKERYKYTPIEDIIIKVKPVLTKHNLSYKFDEVKDEKNVTAVCTITHIKGHSESSSFKVEIGKEDYMSDAQKYGARMTFAKRYAFCNALGIITGGEDTDAGGKDKKAPFIPPEKKTNVKSQIMFLLKTLNVDVEEKKNLPKEIKKLTGLDVSVEANLSEIKDRLEVLVTEQNESR